MGGEKGGWKGCKSMVTGGVKGIRVRNNEGGARKGERGK